MPRKNLRIFLDTAHKNTQAMPTLPTLAHQKTDGDERMTISFYFFRRPEWRCAMLLNQILYE